MARNLSDKMVRDPLVAVPSATVACFDPTQGELPRRGLDEHRTIRFLERFAELGVPAVLIAASTGHGHLRTVKELDEWFRCAARAKMGSTIKTALLRPEDGTEANERLIQVLAELDYPLIYVRPGRNLSSTANDAEVAANMRPVVSAAAAQGLAVGVYSIPDVSGVRLTADATALLLQGLGGDRIVAVKVTEADYESSTGQFLRHRQLQRLKIVQGWDPHIARALQDGQQRCGVTSGPMSFAVLQYLHLLEAARRNDWAEVDAAQAAVTALFQAMQDDPRKFADLQRAKYLMGLGHPLTGTVTDNQVERVFTALENLPRTEDQVRLAQSLDLLGNGPFHARLNKWSRRA